MKKFILLHLLIILIFTARHSVQAQEILPSPPEGEPLRVLQLEGSHYEIGYRYGQEMKEEIAVITGRWKALLEEQWQMSPEAAIEQFLSTTKHVEAIEEACPELLLEVKGIADGSGLPYKTMLAFQMSEEMDIHAQRSPGERCTAIAASGNSQHPTIVSQNMDPPLFLHGYPTILHIKRDNGKEAFILTVPGLIGINGMSKQGVAVACNSISMLNSAGSGLPVAFVLRTILEKNNMDEIDAFLRGIGHATPQTYTVGDREEARCYECSSGGCSTYMTFPGQQVILHTNFAIANRDFNDNFITLLSVYGKTIDDPYFCPRFYLLYDLIAANDTTVDVPFIRQMLRLREPPEHPVLNSETYGTSIMLLDEEPMMYFQTGSSDGSYTKLNFNR